MEENAFLDLLDSVELRQRLWRIFFLAELTSIVSLLADRSIDNFGKISLPVFLRRMRKRKIVRQSRLFESFERERQYVATEYRFEPIR